METMFRVTFISNKGTTHYDSALCPSRIDDPRQFAKWRAHRGLSQVREYVCAQVTEFDPENLEGHVINVATYNRAYFAEYPQQQPENY
ncbi:hypothetical protein ACG2OD_14685 [Streptomyces sp. PDY-4]|uniref:hypothetical protein n=1 Tax=Streptomyces sp. PDY-4 TaxID=3376070 RepID=UPI00378A3723